MSHTTEYMTIKAIDTRLNQHVGTVECIVRYNDRAEVTGEVYGEGRVDIICYKNIIEVKWQGRAYRCCATVNLHSRAEIVEWGAAVLVAIHEGKEAMQKWAV